MFNNNYRNLEQPISLYKTYQSSKEDVYFLMPVSYITHDNRLEMITLKIVFIADELDLFEHHFDIKFLYVVFSIVGRCLYRYMDSAWNNIDYNNRNIFEYSPQKYPKYTLEVSITNIIKILLTVNPPERFFSVKEKFIADALLFTNFDRPHQDEKGYLSYLTVVDDVIEEVLQKEVKLYIAAPYDYTKLIGVPYFEEYKLYKFLIESEEFEGRIQAEEVKKYVMSRKLIPELYNYVFTPDYQYLTHYNGIQLIRISSFKLASNLLFRNNTR